MRRETVRDIVTIIAITILLVGLWMFARGGIGG